MNPGVVEEGGKVAIGVIESLKNQPIVLSLVIFNIVFLGVVGYGTIKARDSFERTTHRFLEMSNETAKMLYNCAPVGRP